MEGNVNITLEELDSLRNDNNYLKNKVEELEGLVEGLKDKSRVVVTRYDKTMSSTLWEKISDSIVDIINEQLNYNSMNFDPFGDFHRSPYGTREECLKSRVNAKVMQLVRTYFDSRNRQDISQVATKFVNFEDIKEQVMKLYELEVVKELNERRELINSKEQELNNKIKEQEGINEDLKRKRIELDKQKELIENELKQTYGEVFEENKTLKNEVKNYKDTAEKERSRAQLIENNMIKRQSEIDSLTETIDFQKKRTDRIKKTWWYQLFANKKEFEN